jgi:hypothetical protein
MDLKILKEIALANVSDPSYEYYYRYVCRWFSKTFHTPLREVYDMPMDQVFLAYFEEGYEKIAESDEGEDILLTDMLKAVDPDYDEKEEESIQEFIEMLEEEEENKRLAKAERDKAKGFAVQDTPKLAPNTSSADKGQAPTNNPPPKEVVRTFVDDTPDDESGDW